MKKLLALLAVTTAVACSPTTNPPTRLALSAGARAAAQPLAAGGASSSIAAGSGIEVTRVRMVVERIELEPTSADGSSSGDAGSSGDGRSGGELALGPYLVDLSGASLAGGVTQVFEVDVPPGDYRRIRFEIHELDAGDARFPEMAGHSILVDGTIDGRDFQYSSDLDEEQEREGLFHIEAGANDNLTLAIDPSGWFTGPGGRLDPTAASDEATIDSNIKDSIEIFDDENRDSSPD